MITAGFLAEFKRATEAKWKNKSIDPAISGFQIRPKRAGIRDFLKN